MKHSWWLIQAIVFMCEDALMKYCALNVLDFVVIVNFLLFYGRITYQGVGTFTEVEGNVNSRKYVNILDTYFWPVISRHFPTDEYGDKTVETAKQY